MHFTGLCGHCRRHVVLWALRRLVWAERDLPVLPAAAASVSARPRSSATAAVAAIATIATIAAATATIAARHPDRLGAHWRRR